ncbi:MAG: ABC transporter ATP-binding protein [Mycolicibacterium insubricum]|nr:ABC transporter ATP-binding protein [Mycobacterium sp.]
MIRTLLALMPPGSRGRVHGYLTLTMLPVLLRAASAVLLVPFVAALFGDDPHRAVPWLGWLTVATVGGWIIDAVVSRLGFTLGFGVLDSSQRDLAQRLPQVQLRWFTAENTATTRSAIAATGPELVGMIVYLLTPLLGAMALPAVIALALAVTVSVPLGLAALAGVAVLFAAMWASIRLSRSADALADESNTELTERIIEFARTQAALRAARRVAPARSMAGAALDAQHGATMRLLAMQIPGQILFSIASQLALILFAGAAAALTVRGQLGAPEAVALIVVLVRYLEPFTALSELAPGIDTTRATLRRIQTVLDAPTLSAGDRGPAGTGAPRIEFDSVGFGYSDDDRVLDDISFALEPGTTTAIVGPSGSGKSTVLSLIAGLYQPDRGAVRFDGVDLAQMDPEARREAVSMVFQHSYLFDGTIADNVLVGHPRADDAALREAFGLARVDELLARLPDGDRSPVGEGGSALSGGERQRVGIARALLKPAPVLLVDEATSALDTENEAAIVAALTDDARSRTRVIVAHRLASIAGADRVLFIEDGRIVEDGGIDELLAGGGRFAEFWDQRRAAADWQLSH